MHKEKESMAIEVLLLFIVIPEGLSARIQIVKYFPVLDIFAHCDKVVVVLCHVPH